MIINHNMMAMNTHRQMGSITGAQSKSTEKLSSGMRINRAGDDAAGLAISEKMRGQIRGLNQASRNAQDGISMVQTAEGALQETQAILQRMRELGVQASNDTLVGADRSEIQKEISQLNSEIDRISNTTEFNTQTLLNGSLGATGTSDASDKVDVKSVTGLQKGDYNCEVTKEAKQATTSSASPYTAGDYTNTSSLSINGVTIDFTTLTGTESAADIATRINSYADQTGVTASESSGTITLDQVNFGSKPDIVLGGSEASTFNATTAGVDAEMTVEKDGVTSKLTGTGQEVIYGTADFTAKAIGTATVTVASSGASIHIGANKDQTMLIDVNQVSTSTLGNDTNKIKDVNVLTADGAETAIKTVDDAIKQVSAERSKLGAFQNRLEHTIKNLDTSSENLQSSESRIRDIDMAQEMVEFTKNNILQQAAQSMLAQANQAPQGVLQLLR